jgi:uncharacterized phiE125 gp8 family phage protein
MQLREKSGQSLAEPVTASEFKTFAGYTGTDQDTLIASMITAARQFFENETGLSVISKVYEVEFDRWDMIQDDLTKTGYSGYDEGWYKLPVSPVTAIASAKIASTSVTYSQKGQKEIMIHPDTVVQTGESSNILQVEFTAGAADTQAKMAILRIVSDMFNNREDNMTGVSVANLSFDTMRMISNLSMNTGF